MRRAPKIGILLPTLCSLIIAGCGRAGPEIVPTRGKVTLDGGAWPKPGVIYFTPLKPAEGFPRRPGTGHFDTDGTFTVTTLDPGDGLIPGTYRIAVECWEVWPEEKPPGKSYVAEPYTSPARSGLELTVEPGTRGPVEVKHDIPGRASPRD